MQTSSLTVGPFRKIARAEELFADALSRIETWAASNPITSRSVLSEDHRRIDAILAVATEPPLEEVSLVIGDALHNLRSALDGLVWNLAHMDVAPSRPRDVQFPVVSTPKQWRDAAKKLPTVPPAALSKILEFQFLELAAPGASFVSILHDLDIRDKHHDFLTAHGQILDIELGDLKIGTDVETQLGPIEGNLRLAGINGATLASMPFSQPIRADIDPGGYTRFSISYEVHVYDGFALSMHALAATFPTTTRAIIDAICGELGSEGSDAAAADALG